MTLLRVVVSLGLLAFVLHRIGLGDTLDLLRAADPWMVLAVFFFMLLINLHATYKWHILLRHTTASVRYWPLLRIRYISGFVGMFLPGAVGIEMVRMYGLARHTSDLAASFTSILMDRILGLTGLALMILAGVMLETRGTDLGVPGAQYWAGGLLALILAGWLAIMNRSFRRLTDWALSPNWLSFVRSKQNKVYASLDAYRGRPGLLAWGMVQSVIFNTLRVLVTYCGAMAVGVEAPLTAYIIVVPLVIFAIMVPVSLAGWGVREAMYLAMFKMYGADSDAVLAMSLLLGVIGTLSSLPGAWFCIRGYGKAVRATHVKEKIGKQSPTPPNAPPTI